MVEAAGVEVDRGFRPGRFCEFPKKMNVAKHSIHPNAWVQVQNRYSADWQIGMSGAPRAWSTDADPGQCSNVRAVSNQPSIVAAIDRVAAASAGKIMAGPVSRVANCSQFSDLLGHLTDEGAKRVQQQLREFYRK